MRSTQARSRVPAGISGTSAGTALSGGSLGVGPESTLGKVMLLVSPLTSVVVGSLFFYLQAELARYLEARMVSKARTTVENALDNPRYTETEHEHFRGVLLDVDTLAITRRLEWIRDRVVS